MIREARIEDADIISDYNCLMARETEDKELCPETVLNGVNSVIKDETRGKYFLYEKDDKVVGQLMITLEWSDWRNGFFWWIQSVYVQKEYRRQGIFKALYKHVESLVNSDQSACGLRLYVEKENEKAKSTYSNLGMHETDYLLFEMEK